MATMISPRYADTKLERPAVIDVIDVFEDRVRGWVLHPARTLLGIPHGSIAAFCLALMYFEGAWSYIVGKTSRDRSKDYFINGLVDVFREAKIAEPLLRRIASMLYADARCGFFHEGMFRDRIYFARSPGIAIRVTLPKRDGAIDENGAIQSLLIDPAEFVSSIEMHFSRLVKSLRDESNVALRETFWKFAKTQSDWETPGPVIGIEQP